MGETITAGGGSVSPSTTESSAPSWKRFREANAALQPLIELDADGTIRHLSPPARRLLEYRADQSIQPSFFSHVHAKNQYQVMRDVADMVCYGKKQASWLLRLRTGKQHWRWFQATVRNQLSAAPATILVSLQEVRDW